MHIPFSHGPGAVGREDRLVRACIALSLLLLVGFVLALSGEPGVVGWLFGVLALYFSATAALGRDPFYAHFDIDTRTDAPHETEPQVYEPWPPLQHHWVDLRDSQADVNTGPTGNSLLGN